MATTTHYPDGLVAVSATADVAFVNGAPDQVPADIGIYWDFDNDGDFDEAVEDVTDRVMSAESFTGRDFPSQVTGHAAAGSLLLTLDNTDDRFSTLNTASPVNGGAMSLRTGRRVQVRTVGTPDPQPTLLARDRFLGGDGPLSTDELGNAWTTGMTYGLDRVSGQAVGNTSYSTGDVHVSLVDVGTADYVVSARLSTLGAKTSGLLGNTVGIVFRWQDSSNYSRFELDVDAALLRVIDTVAGVDSTVTTAGVEARDDFMLSVWVLGAGFFAYLDGVFLLSGTAIQTDETQVGLWAEWGANRQPPPGVDLFEVWSSALQPTSGVLWTGEVEKVTTSVGRDRQKVATVRCRGRLAKLVDRPVEAARFSSGQGTGFMVGRVLNLAGQLSPLAGGGAIDGGTAALGLITSDSPTVDAIDAAHGFELAERGFLYERTDGALAFNSLAARAVDAASTSPRAWFSDAPGAQLGFEEVEPLDALRDVVNRVRVGVASSVPLGGYVASAAQNGAGVAAHVAATYAGLGITPVAGKLVVFVIASTVRTVDQDWRSPTGYTQHVTYDQGDAIGLRVYSRILDGTEVAVTFYNDSGLSGGNYRIFVAFFDPGQWYGAPEGLYVSDVAEGSDPGPLFPPWEGAGTRFLAVRAGLQSTTGAAVGSPVGTVAPLGYTTVHDAFDNGVGSQAFDLGLQVADRADVYGFADPGRWDGTFGPFTTVQSLTIAVRGANGDPPVRGTVVAEFNDVASQDDHGQVMTLEATAAPFADEDEAEAYATDVLSTYRNERPIIGLTFTATRNALARATAADMWVNDRVHVKADGESGLGFAGDFFVEAVRHYWTDGAKRWVCTLELSPA